MRAPETPVRASQAADELGIPRATVRSWTKEPNRRLFPIDRDIDGAWIYDLADVKRLAAETHARPKRRKRA